MSTLLKRLRGIGSRAATSGEAPDQERRGSNRRPIDAPAICIPLEKSSKKAFVVGVHWCHHLMEESLEVVANREAKSKGCSHVYTNGRNGTVYGVVNVDPKDLAQNGTLLPLAVAFAKSVPDKNARAIYVFDMRDSPTSGWVYFAVVQRGNPIKEVLCPAEKYFNLLANLANDASTPASVFVDTPDEDTFAFIASAYASATQWPLSKIGTANVDPIHRVKAFNFTTTQLVLVVLALGGVLTYTYGLDYYKANLQAKSDEDLQRKVAQQYINGRQQNFTAGYGASPDAAVEALQSTVASMPLFRNGWQFKEAVCAVDTGTCVYEWSRVYGTNDSFAESASLDSLKFDPTNYKVIKEERGFKADVNRRPEWSSLPEVAQFVRDNGDRSDTFALAGLDEYTTEPMTDLLPWTGRGVPPGPVLTTAGWTLNSPIELVYEAIANRRIGPEFGVNKLTVNNRDGQIYLKLEGKVYARKS
jgi:hypothetical protein